MIDFADIRGQDAAIDALIGAILRGETGVLLQGPPGAGRNMFGQRIPTILAPLTAHERRWIRAAYDSISMDHPRMEEPGDRGLPERPHRAPHHTISTAALVGERRTDYIRRAECLDAPGVRTVCRCQRAVPAHTFHSLPTEIVPRAGEVQLARFGVLSLNELLEFPRVALHALGAVLRRMHGRPFVVATVSPCLCGWRGVMPDTRACSCSDAAVERHDARIREAMANLDIHTIIAVPSLARLDMLRLPPGPSSAVIRDRIARARAGQ